MLSSFAVNSTVTADNGNSAIFQEIEAISLTEWVIAALKNAFFSGVLKPGEMPLWSAKDCPRNERRNAGGARGSDLPQARRLDLFGASRTKAVSTTRLTRTKFARCIPYALSWRRWRCNGPARSSPHRIWTSSNAW